LFVDEFNCQQKDGWWESLLEDMQMLGFRLKLWFKWLCVTMAVARNNGICHCINYRACA
jgi:hypothetical protein